MDDLSKMSVEDLKSLLAHKEKEERERKREERSRYERYIEDSLHEIVTAAVTVSCALSEFHQSASARLDEMRRMLSDYGAIRSNSKGGYHRITADGKWKIVYEHSTVCDWDERSTKAEGLLRDFLKDFVKKRDLKMYNVISALLEKNKEGNLEYARIQSLYSQENEFDDPRWKEAIRLFKESYRPVSSKMYIRIYTRSDVSQKWELLPLNLSNF